MLPLHSPYWLCSGPPSAADLSRPVYKAAPPPPPACAQFGGFYVGGYGAAGYYDHKWNDRDAWTSENSDDLQRSNVSTQKTGFIGGVQGGYNWQTGCTVFGLQADYGWASINADAFETDGDTGIDTDSLSVSSRLKGVGTLRLRTGIVVDNLLLYVTGGLAYGHFNRTSTQTDLNAPCIGDLLLQQDQVGLDHGCRHRVGDVGQLEPPERGAVCPIREGRDVFHLRGLLRNSGIQALRPS